MLLLVTFRKTSTQSWHMSKSSACGLLAGVINRERCSWTVSRQNRWLEIGKAQWI